jgi:hypothetical protein
LIGCVLRVTNTLQDQFFNFSRVVVAGAPGYPGKGMGATLILPSESTPAASTGGSLPGINIPRCVRV